MLSASVALPRLLLPQILPAHGVLDAAANGQGQRHLTDFVAGGLGQIDKQIEVDMQDTDRAWEEIASKDPYWGVLSHERYLGQELSPDMQVEFFKSGEDHISGVLATLNNSVDPDFNPRSALDFGCGVGRFLLPLANRCGRVIGVDVSPTMLQLAHSYCDNSGVDNVELLCSSDLSELKIQVDFVHSALVFQHIPPSRGFAILERLVAMIAPGGCGVLQMHLRGSGNEVSRRVRALRARSRSINRAYVFMTRRPQRSSLVLMHEYDSTQVLRILNEGGADRVLVQTESRPDGHTNATFFFDVAGARPTPSPTDTPRMAQEQSHRREAALGRQVPQ